MLKSVSWSQYFLWLSIFLVIYYSTVVWFFHRKEIGSFFSRKRDTREDYSFSPIEKKLLNDIIALHHETVYRDIPKEELVLNLKTLVQQSKGINIQRIDQFIRETFNDWIEQDYRRIIQ